MTISTNKLPDALPDSLRDWCQSIIGNSCLFTECSHEHGESQVWHVQTAEGNAYFLKRHRRDTKREREVWAYTHATPLFAAYASRLIAVYEESPQAILLSALDGKPMECIPLTPVQERAAWHRAGEVLSRLHSLQSPWFGVPDQIGQPISGWQSDAESLWKARLESWIVRAEKGEYLSPDEIRFARKLAESVSVFYGEAAVAAHHDYTPRNWIISPDTGEWLGVIDFEHSCFDVRVADFKLHYDLFFAKRPDLEESFFAGYGRLLSPPEQTQLRIVHLLQAVSGVVWSREHNDTRFAAENYAILKRLQS